jgi:hypothetical protein
MKSLPLHIELRSWILSVIRQRKALIRMGKSRADNGEMNRIIDYLTLHLNYYAFNNEQKIAGFFLRNQDKIGILLPGKGSNSYEIRAEQYKRYLILTKNIKENENLHHRSVRRTGIYETEVSYQS